MRKVGVAFSGTGFVLFAVSWINATAVFGQTTNPRPAQIAEAYTYHIPAGTLQSVLSSFAEASRLALVYPSTLTVGQSSPGLDGSFTPEDALRQLLRGTGLVSRYTDRTTLTLERASDSTRELPRLQVEGSANSFFGVGANGSTDVTATEGTDSYVGADVRVGSKAPLSVRQTPQSVSEVTAQQMQDQNIHSLTDLMSAAPGISVFNSTNGDTAPTYNSRGLLITAFQLDGGAPVDNGLNANGFTPQFDMAEFDHAEILRGSDGLFTGFGDSAGTVNLVRKRPLDHPQSMVEGDLGSWQNYRLMGDVTGPLAFDGNLRGRFVISYQSQNYFYDIANENHTLLYGTLEYSAGPSTLLTAYSSFTDSDQVPWFTGLPRYENGAAIQFPRSASLALPWATWDVHTTELGGRIEQRLADQWSAKLDITEIKQSIESNEAFVSGAISPVTLQGAEAYGYGLVNSNHQILADLNITGAFEAFGRRQEIVVGGSMQNLTNNYTESDLDSPGSVDIFPFNPNEYPNPGAAPVGNIYAQTQRQRLGYLTLRLLPLEHLHITPGVQVASYSYLDTNSYTDSSPASALALKDDNKALPYFGAVYDVSRAWSVYASWTDILISQSRYLQAPYPPGTPLDPLTGAEIEGGAKAELRDGKLKASISIYRIDMNNQSEYIDYEGPGTAPGSSCCYVRVGKNVSKGIDLELNGELLPGLQLAASYNYNENYYDYETAYTPKGTPLETQFPKHIAKAWATYRLPFFAGRASVGGGVTGQSKTFVSGSIPSSFDPTTGEGDPPYIPFNFTQSGYWIPSIFGGFQINDHLLASVKLNNITNKIYYGTVNNPESGNWYGAPFNYMVSLRYRL